MKDRKPLGGSFAGSPCLTYGRRDLLIASAMALSQLIVRWLQPPNHQHSRYRRYKSSLERPEESSGLTFRVNTCAVLRLTLEAPVLVHPTTISYHHG